MQQCVRESIVSIHIFDNDTFNVCIIQEGLRVPIAIKQLLILQQMTETLGLKHPELVISLIVVLMLKTWIIFGMF